MMKDPGRRGACWILVFALFLAAAGIRAEEGPSVSALDPELVSLLRFAYQDMQRGELERSERFFRDVLEKDVGNHQARFGLGTLLVKRNQYREAIEILEALLGEHPGDFTVKNNLAWIYATATDLSVRNGGRAIELAQDALISQPLNYHVWSTLSEAHFILGRFERSVRAAEEAQHLSRSAGLPRERVEAYARQVEKATRAARAFALTE